MTRDAACNCGQLTVRCEGEPVRISMCHCFACQRRTGSVFGAQARFPDERVVIGGKSTAYVRGEPGARATFHFCAICGSTVYYRLEKFPGVTAVAIGMFADPTFPTPKISVWESRKHSWVVLPEGIEHHD
jgi:hypothetical protein